MKVCVNHYFFLGPSGGTLVNATVVDELIENGVETVISTMFPVDLKTMFLKLYNMHPGLRGNPRIYTTFPSMMKHFPFLSLFNWLPLRKALQNEDIDVLFTDNPVLKPIKALLDGKKVIYYCHFPSFPSWLSLRYESGLFRKFYWGFYDTLSFLGSDFSCIDVIVCNSEWTRDIFTSIYGIKSLVIHPPVRVGKFYSDEKENGVLMVGTFRPGKKFETAIRAVSKCESKAELRLVGGVVTLSKRYLNYLEELANELGIARKVHFHVNASDDELRRIMSHSKISLSCRAEHFGVAVVEQMASGCVPVVYKDGGAWTDIVEYGKYGYGFETVNELSKIIDELLTDENLFMKASEIAIKRAKVFDETVFRQKISGLILNFR